MFRMSIHIFMLVPIVNTVFFLKTKTFLIVIAQWSDNSNYTLSSGLIHKFYIITIFSYRTLFY